MVTDVPQPGMLCSWQVDLCASDQKSRPAQQNQHHFVRELVQAGEVKFQYVRSQENVADIFTKPLDRVLFQRFSRLLNERLCVVLNSSSLLHHAVSLSLREAVRNAMLHANCLGQQTRPTSKNASDFSSTFLQVSRQMHSINCGCVLSCCSIHSKFFLTLNIINKRSLKTYLFESYYRTLGKLSIFLRNIV